LGLDVSTTKSRLNLNSQFQLLHHLHPKCVTLFNKPKDGNKRLYKTAT